MGHRRGHRTWRRVGAAVAVTGSALWGGSGTAGASPASFAPPTFQGVGSLPHAVAVGDFNGDGNADIATADTASGQVHVLLGDGSGGFALGSAPQVGGGPVALALGDFNGDRRADLAVAVGASSSVNVLLGDGRGNFTMALYPVGPGPSAVAVGDFDGDGHADLAVASAGSDTMAVLLGQPDGTFAPVPANPAVGPDPTSVAVGDFNGDGHADLAVVNANFGGSGTVAVLPGNGDGTFAPAETYPVGQNPAAVAVGDFNDDGHADLAVANEGSSTISVLLGDGAGEFVPVASLEVGANPHSLAVADFDGDGHADLAVASFGLTTVSILSGDGTGGFAAPQAFPAGRRPVAVAVGDFDNDGQPDLAAADAPNPPGGYVAILRNLSTAPVSAPSCTLRAVLSGPHKQIVIGVSDLRSSITRVKPTVAANAKVRVSPFVPLGTFSPEVQVVATKVNEAESAQVALRVTNGLGRVTACDPVVATVTSDGDSDDVRLSGLGPADHLVTVANGEPGLRRLTITVNHQRFILEGLVAGELCHLDIGGAMGPGDTNTVVLRGRGHPGASADILIAG